MADTSTRPAKVEELTDAQLEDHLVETEGRLEGFLSGCGPNITALLDPYGHARWSQAVPTYSVLPRAQRGEFEAHWNAYVKAQAQTALRSALGTGVPPPSHSVWWGRQWMWTRPLLFALGLASLVVGFNLGGWIGVGIGLCLMALLTLIVMVNEAHEAIKRNDEIDNYRHRYELALRAKLHLLGYQLSNGLLLRDESPGYALPLVMPGAIALGIYDEQMKAETKG